MLKLLTLSLGIEKYFNTNKLFKSFHLNFEKNFEIYLNQKFFKVFSQVETSVLLNNLTSHEAQHPKLPVFQFLSKSSDPAMRHNKAGSDDLDKIGKQVI